jgi:hypothetical protein
MENELNYLSEKIESLGLDIENIEYAIFSDPDQDASLIDKSEKIKGEVKILESILDYITLRALEVS